MAKKKVVKVPVSVLSRGSLKTKVVFEDGSTGVVKTTAETEALPRIPKKEQASIHGDFVSKRLDELGAAYTSLFSL